MDRLQQQHIQLAPWPTTSSGGGTPASATPTPTPAPMQPQHDGDGARFTGMCPFLHAMVYNNGQMVDVDVIMAQLTKQHAAVADCGATGTNTTSQIASFFSLFNSSFGTRIAGKRLSP